MNSLVEANELFVGAPILNFDADTVSGTGSRYNTFDSTIVDWENRGTVNNNGGSSSTDYTNDNVTYINETEITYRNKIIEEEEARASDAMKIAIGAVVAGIVVIIAVGLTVRFICNKNKQKKGVNEAQI